MYHHKIKELKENQEKLCILGGQSNMPENHIPQIKVIKNYLKY